MQTDSRKLELAIAGVLLAVALFFLWGAWHMPPGAAGVPGPALLPAVAAFLLAATAVLLGAQALAGSPGGGSAPIGFGITSTGTALVSLLVVSLVLDRAGFIVAVGAFMAVMLRVFSPLGTLRSVVVGIAVAAAAFLVFDGFLDVRLPRGDW